MSFATRLKKLRTVHNVTQQELADYLNVTRPTIAGYETKGNEPDYHTLLLIASYFHVSADYLLTGKNFPESVDSSTSLTECDMGYEDFVILNSDIKPSVAQIIERVSKMDSYDVKHLLEYSELLLFQPKYSKKTNS